VAIRLVLADDQRARQTGIEDPAAGARGSWSRGEAADGREAVRLVRSENPDVAVMDISMPQFNGLNAALELARLCPRVRLVVLTQHDEPQYVTEALRCGVRGATSSRARRRATWCRRSKAFAAARLYLSPGVAGAVAEAYLAPQHATAALSVRRAPGAAG